VPAAVERNSNSKGRVSLGVRLPPPTSVITLTMTTELSIETVDNGNDPQTDSKFRAFIDASCRNDGARSEEPPVPLKNTTHS